MEFLHITSPEDPRADEIYERYVASFPEDERRSREQFLKLFSKPSAKIFTVLKNFENIGYLIAWELSNFVFLEHFEIYSEFRSQKFGSEVIKNLFHDYSKIILEAEPETLDDNAARRIAFYQRNGFNTVDEDYTQPAYAQDKNAVKLWLMANYHPENLNNIKEEIYDVVYCH